MPFSKLHSISYNVSKLESPDRCDAQYQALYGKAPEIVVAIDEHGTLTGRLNNFEIPPIAAFCSLFHESKMKSLLHDFGTTWLFNQALNKAIKVD